MTTDIEAARSEQRAFHPGEFCGIVRLRTLVYTLLTSIIILVGTLRKWLCRRDEYLRGDRALPWVPNDADTLLMRCCDCGLTHFFVCGRSATVQRPLWYDYRLRFGVVAWTDPDVELGREACRLYEETAPGSAGGGD